MGSGKILPLRALPRFFISGADLAAGPVELGPDDWKKVHNVLRLSSGDQIAILPNDGSLWRCTLKGHSALPEEQNHPDTESPIHLTLAQATLKGDKLDEVIRRGTEIGVQTFELFPSDRSVVRWDANKMTDKLRRWNAIAREAAELSYRTRLPQIVVRTSLTEVLKNNPSALVLSEAEGALATLQSSQSLCLIIGPEGGWSPKELEATRERAITLGPRVLSADTAAIAACALTLLK